MSRWIFSERCFTSLENIPLKFHEYKKFTDRKENKMNKDKMCPTYCSKAVCVPSMAVMFCQT